MNIHISKLAGTTIGQIFFEGVVALIRAALILMFWPSEEMLNVEIITAEYSPFQGQYTCFKGYLTTEILTMWHWNVDFVPRYPLENVCE